MDYSLKIKLILIITTVVILFTPFNFYSKTYLSITTDDRVSEYQLILKDSQQNISRYSHSPPTAYPFFYIFNENYIPFYQPMLGYFTAYFPLDTSSLFQSIEFKVSSKGSTIYVKKICLHNSFKEKCWNTQEIPQVFYLSSPYQLNYNELSINQQQLVLHYKDDFANLHQQFLNLNYLKIFLLLCIFAFWGYLFYQGQKLFFSLFQNKPQIIFLWLGSMFGILTCFINPPFQVPDELYHFSQAFYLTQYPESKLFPTNAIISAAELHLHYRHSSNLPEEKLYYLSQLPLHLQNTLQTIYTQHYSLFPYFPSAIGIYIGKIFELSWGNIISLARISNLLMWLFCGYLAIRFIPIGKWLLCLIALSPMSIFQAASMSIDSLVNGLSFLLIALILKFILQEQSRKITFFSILIVSIFLFLSKFPYIILLSLILLFFTQRPLKFSDFLTSIFSVVLILSSSLYLYFNQPSPTNITYQQLYLIIHQPIDFIGLIIETLKLNGISFIKEWVGKFGWLEIELPNWFITLHLMMLTLFALTDSSSYVLSKLSRLLILIIFLFGVLVIFASLYAIETPLLNLSYIDGIQGRYFIPLGILPFLLFQNKVFSLPNNTHIILSGIYIPFSLIFMLITISNYYRI